MDVPIARRLEAIERRLLAMEARFGPPPMPGGDPSPDVVPEPAAMLLKPPPLPKRTVSPTQAELDSERYAANMRAAYDGDPPHSAAASARFSPGDSPVESPPGSPVTPPRVPPVELPAEAVPAMAAVDGPAPDSPGGIPFAAVAGDRPPLGDAFHNRRLAEKRELLQHRVWAAAGDAPKRRAKLDFDLEQALGLRWAGWIGAVVLMIGAALGVKYAYDRGWLGGMSDGLRTALIALAGLALVGVGEFVFRRVHRLAATGPYAAGVGVLFLATYAGQAWYGLFGPLVGVVLLATVAALGMVLAARAELVSIASLAVICATVCPFFMGEDGRHAVGIRPYLLAIQCMAIGLCAWRATPRWWALRGLALVATTISQLALFDPATGGRIEPLAVAFAAVSAVLYQSELIYTTLRWPGTSLAQSATGVTFSMLTTAALTLELMACLDGQSRPTHARVLVGLALVAFALGQLRAWRKLAAIGRGFYVQSVMLAALAIPVRLDGPAMLLAWVILAGGLAAGAMIRRDRLTAGFAIGVWALATVVAFTWARTTPDAGHVWLRIGGETVTAAVVIGVVLAVGGHVVALAAHRLWPEPMRGDVPTPSVGLLVDSAAVLAFMTMLVLHASNELATRVGLAYALALWSAAFVPAAAPLSIVATVLLALLAVKWAGIDVLIPRLARGWTPVGRPFVNAQTATGLVLAAAFVLVGHTGRRRALRDGRPATHERADRGWAIVLAAAFALVGFGISVAIDRASVLEQLRGAPTDWPTYTRLNLLLTALWAGVTAAWALTVRRTTTTDVVRRDAMRCARAIAYLLAAKFLLIDVLGAGVNSPRAAMGNVVNLQTGVMLLVIAFMAFTNWPRTDLAPGPWASLATLVVLWVTGSAEIDRYARQQTDGPVWIVRQVGWSIYWSALAVVTLVVGLARRQRSLRLSALGLLAATLVKVTFFDLASAGTGWRILSFLGLGVLLLTTSVLYGRFEKRMREEPAECPAAG